eukprot:3253275-Lingulodinium_polyedra.AAC.1
MARRCRIRGPGRRAALVRGGPPRGCIWDVAETGRRSHGPRRAAPPAALLPGSPGASVELP